MTKDQWLYDCLVVLPELYKQLVETQNQRFVTDKLQEFADNHRLDYDTVLNIATEWYNYAQVFEIVDELYGEENPRVIRLPEGLEEIPENTFIGDTMESVYIPKSVKKIGYAAFERCESLRNVRFAEESCLEEVFTEAFESCYALSNITIPAGAKVYRGVFKHTEYYKQLLLGEKACPKNVFSSFTDVEKLLVCTNSINVSMPDYASYLLYTFQEKPDNIIHSLIINEQTERMKVLFDIVAGKNNITWLMKKVIEETEKTGNMELRLEMMDYQREKKLFPKQECYEL